MTSSDLQPIPSAPPGLPAPRRCDVGLVFALGIEAGAFEDRLAVRSQVNGQRFTIREGWLKRQKIALVISGPGQQLAAAATDALIAGHRPRWLISAGFAGGLRDEIRRNDLLLPDLVAPAADDGQAPLAVELPSTLAGLLKRSGVHRGTLLTGQRIVHQAAEKRRLGIARQAAAVDMETLAVAQTCQQLQQPFLSVRVVSDAVADELPRDLERLMARQSTARLLGAVAGALFRRPASLQDMWRLHESAISAASRLATFLVEMIELLAKS